MKNSQTHLRKLVEQIFKHCNKKTITKEEFLGCLQEQGYTREQAIEIYNKAAEQKMIDSSFIIRQDQKGRIEKIIVVEYMTEEDWEMIEAVERETEQEEKLKRILQKEPTKEEIKKILKELNPE